MQRIISGPFCMFMYFQKDSVSFFFSQFHVFLFKSCDFFFFLIKIAKNQQENYSKPCCVNIHKYALHVNEDKLFPTAALGQGFDKLKSRDLDSEEQNI